MFVDYREGSHDLVQPLQERHIEVVETELQFGDLAFAGKGVGGKSVDIGIEFKKLEELVDSMRTGRLTGHQLPGMRGARKGQDPLYDFAWLVFEGELLYDKQGRLLKRVGRTFFKPIHGGMTINELYKRLTSIQLGWGVSWVNTRTRRDTLQFLEALYRTWTDRAQDDHTSHLGLYTPPALEPVSAFRQTVSGPLFPGISLTTSEAVEQAFDGSLREAVNASAKTWAAIEVIDKHGKAKKFGQKRAERIIASITGGSDEQSR